MAPAVHSMPHDFWVLLYLEHEYELVYIMYSGVFIGILQGKSDGFDSCDRPRNLTQIGFKSLIC